MSERRDRLLLVGAGSFGRIVLEHAARDYDCAFLDDGKTPGELICGAPVLGGVSELERFREEYPNLVVTVGNNRFRQRVYESGMALGYRFPNIVSSDAYISPYASLGRGCVILNHAVIQNGAWVGDGVLINAGVELHGDCKIESWSLIYGNSVIRTGVYVGVASRIGSNVTLETGARIEPGSDIASGTVVFCSE